jgi:hypothetical protein
MNLYRVAELGKHSADSGIERLPDLEFHEREG